MLRSSAHGLLFGSFTIPRPHGEREQTPHVGTLRLLSRFWRSAIRLPIFHMSGRARWVPASRSLERVSVAWQWKEPVIGYNRSNVQRQLRKARHEVNSRRHRRPLSLPEELFRPRDR